MGTEASKAQAVLDAVALPEFWRSDTDVEPGVRKALRDGGNPDLHRDGEGRTALALAVERGWTETAKALLSAGADARATDKRGTCVLSKVVGECQRLETKTEADAACSLIRALVASGADLEARRPGFGYTCLMDAAALSTGDQFGGTRSVDKTTKLISVLMELGSDVNARSTTGYSVLHAVVGGSGCSAQCVRALLSAGADLSHRDSRGRTPLVTAVEHNQSTKLQVLIEAKADLEARDNADQTPLMVAAAHQSRWDGKNRCLELLLDSGANVAARTKDGSTALHCAVRDGTEKRAELLLAAGADPNAADDKGVSVLMSAAWKRNADVALVRRLIAAGSDVNGRDEKGRTALFGAPPTVATVLLDNGAVVDAATVERWTPLMDAVSGGYRDRTAALIAAGANVNARDVHGRSALMVANSAEVTRVLLSAGARVDVASFECETPLMLATLRFGDSLKLLLAAGADTNINAKDCFKQSALMRAVNGMYGDPSLPAVQALLAAGADAETRDAEGETALQRAVTWSGQFGYGKVPEIVTALVQAGADVNARSPDQWDDTPLIRVARRCHPGTEPGVLAALVHAGADVNSRNYWGETALIGAATNAKAVALLVESGADVNARADSGWTALMLACRALSGPSIRVLLAASADVNIAGPTGRTALVEAAASDQKNATSTAEVIQLLIDAGANHRDRALWTAAWACKLEAVKTLVQAGARIESAKLAQFARETDRKTNKSAYNEVIEFLRGVPKFDGALDDEPDSVTTAAAAARDDLSAHEKPKLTQAELDRAVYDAAIRPARSGEPRATGAARVRELVADGANPDGFVNACGQTALIAAAKWSSHETVKALLECGAQPNARDANGTTALMRCVRCRDPDYARDYSSFSIGADNAQTIELLLKHGGDIDLRDADGWTALMHASALRKIPRRNSIYTSWTEAMLKFAASNAKVLLDAGADVDASGKLGETATALAHGNATLLAHISERRAYPSRAAHAAAVAARRVAARASDSDAAAAQAGHKSRVDTGSPGGLAEGSAGDAGSASLEDVGGAADAMLVSPSSTTTDSLSHAARVTEAKTGESDAVPPRHQGAKAPVHAAAGAGAALPGQRPNSDGHTASSDSAGADVAEPGGKAVRVGAPDSRRPAAPEPPSDDEQAPPRLDPDGRAADPPGPVRADGATATLHSGRRLEDPSTTTDASDVGVTIADRGSDEHARAGEPEQNAARGTTLSTDAAATALEGSVDAVATSAAVMQAIVSGREDVLSRLLTEGSADDAARVVRTAIRGNPALCDHYNFMQHMLHGAVDAARLMRAGLAGEVKAGRGVTNEDTFDNVADAIAFLKRQVAGVPMADAVLGTVEAGTRWLGSRERKIGAAHLCALFPDANRGAQDATIELVARWVTCADAPDIVAAGVDAEHPSGVFTMRGLRQRAQALRYGAEVDDAGCPPKKLAKRRCVSVVRAAMQGDLEAHIARRCAAAAARAGGGSGPGAARSPEVVAQVMFSAATGTSECDVEHVTKVLGDTLVATGRDSMPDATDAQAGATSMARLEGGGPVPMDVAAAMPAMTAARAAATVGSSLDDGASPTAAAPAPLLAAAGTGTPGGTTLEAALTALSDVHRNMQAMAEREKQREDEVRAMKAEMEKLKKRAARAEPPSGDVTVAGGRAALALAHPSTAEAGAGAATVADMGRELSAVRAALHSQGAQLDAVTGAVMRLSGVDAPSTPSHNGAGAGAVGATDDEGRVRRKLLAAGAAEVDSDDYEE